MKIKILLITFAYFLSGALFSQIIHIPADYNTIQEGINAATDGDTVLVAEGTFFENINFNGKAITLASNFIIDGDTNHISNTIIDGSQPVIPDLGSVVTFNSGEDTTSVLCGFTITGGTGTFVPQHNAVAGGGIYSYPAGCKIVNNIIENNIIDTQFGGWGAGILSDHNDESWSVIIQNRIMNNQCKGYDVAFGAGICVFGNARIENNSVINNASLSQTAISGGGITCQGTYYNSDYKEIIVSNNFIENNSAYSQSTSTEGGYNGGLLIQGYFGIVSQNYISNNSVSATPEQQCYGAGLISLRNSDYLIVENNIIRDNYFISGKCIGGGLCVWSSGGVYQNNVIQNNSGHFGGGVGIAFSNDNEIAALINNTISGNDGNYGGGLYIYEAYAVVLNSILWNNEATDEGNEILNLISDLNVQYSNIEGEEAWPGEGNINIDPGFQVDGYHLDWSSMMVNMGESLVYINGEYYEIPITDIEGDERPFEGTQPDIGADEAQWFYTVTNELGESEKLCVTTFPNPFTTSTTIEYEITKPTTVQLTIYDFLGRQVDRMELQQPQGKQQIVWNAVGLPTGVYQVRLKAGVNLSSVKIVLLNEN